MEAREITKRALILAAVLAAVFALPGTAQAKTKLVTASKTFTSTTPDQTNQRYEVYCPKGSRPFGGGVSVTPPVSSNGDGVYPTSSERLGKQEGWHITVVQQGQGTYQVTLQVYCLKSFKGNIDPVENVLGFHADPGQSVTVDARCPGKKKLVTGGFLTSQFFSPAFGGGSNGKGVYITESRANGNSWRVTAMGVPGGGTGGSFNPIAYCLKSKHKLIKQVTGAPAAITGVGALGTSTATGCTKKKPLAFGGYSAPVDGSVKAFDTTITSPRTWSASGIGFLGAGSITAYGYCLLV